MNVIVDTSIWSLALRRKAKDLSVEEKRLVFELMEIVNEGRTVLIGPIRQEILSGIRDSNTFQKG